MHRSVSCELWWHVYAQLFTCALDLHLVRCMSYVVCCISHVAFRILHLACCISHVAPSPSNPNSVRALHVPTTRAGTADFDLISIQNPQGRDMRISFWREALGAMLAWLECDSVQPQTEVRYKPYCLLDEYSTSGYSMHSEEC